MTEGILFGLVLVGIIVVAIVLLVTGLFAFIEGDMDGQYTYRGRSDESLLYGPIREAIYQFAYARRLARQERIEAIRAERRERGLD